ncbi:MAG: PH domain-containing protein [Candidatus Bathyarchaeia archaeon]|nr:PH domain-containing protein [Candidatus Bathyarchaeota archaeon]
MVNLKDFDLFSSERVEVSLKPHPLSFLKYYLACLYLSLIAIAFHIICQWLRQNVWSNPSIAWLLNLLFSIVPGLRSEEMVSLIIFWAILVLSGLLMGVLWVSKMPLLYMILIGASGTILEIYLYPEPATKSAILFLSTVIGLILVDIYRRGHEFLLTNYRIIAIKRFIGKEVREVMYDKISDLYMHQGLLGRIFNYGTIIPVSESGFGLGEDASLATASAGTIAKGGSIGITVGGKRSVSRPRAATYFSLYGVPDPRRIRGIIGSKMLEMKEAPILRRIEGLLREEREKKGAESGAERL